MGERLEIKKILNNNVVIAAHPEHKELVIIGKGIGFRKKDGDWLDEQVAEKIFVLKNEREREQYERLVLHVSEQLIEIMNDVMLLIQQRIRSPLNEHIHIALTDHIAFAIKRVEQGLAIENPFLLETKAMYPVEYEIAGEVVQMLNDRLNIQLPEGEIGFITLHIYSSLTNSELSSASQNAQLVSHLLSFIEKQLRVQLNLENIHCMRFVRHLHYTIERAINGEEVEEPQRLADILKEEYPVSYNLAWKLIKVLQNELKRPVHEAEAIYLTMHLHRIVERKSARNEPTKQEIRKKY